MEHGKMSNNWQKILFITQDDPFYIRVFFEEFFKSKSDRENILGVVICPTMGKRSVVQLIKQMYDFYGLRDFLRMLWRFVTVKLQGNTLRNTCKKYNIPVYEEYDINSDDFIYDWKGKNLDIIVSVAAPKIFEERLINLPKWGCINIHHAKLPSYRGMMPNFWQMYNAEKSAGVTVHKINTKIDEGEIILQKEIAIEEKDSLDSLIRRSKKIGAHCIIEALELIKQRKVVYLPNHKEKGSYFSFPNRADVLEFRRRGKRIL